MAFVAEILLDDKSYTTEINEPDIVSAFLGDGTETSGILNQYVNLFGVVLTVDNIISITEK